MNFPLRRALLLLLALAAVARAAAPPAAPEEALRVAQRVRDIFEAKCLDCHGPELPRPKGKFGYVLDLPRMAANPDYVTPGDPEKSELYKMVFSDEMPGEDANVPALTPEEKETVRRWVEMGAPGDVAPATQPDLPGLTDAAHAERGAGLEARAALGGQAPPGFHPPSRRPHVRRSPRGEPGLDDAA